MQQCISVLTGLMCHSRNKAHGQAVLILHGLLRQVVGLPDAADCAAVMRTHREPRQQSDQDGLHHNHGDVLPHAGTRPAAEGLEEAIGHLGTEEVNINDGCLYLTNLL